MGSVFFLINSTVSLLPFPLFPENSWLAQCLCSKSINDVDHQLKHKKMWPYPCVGKGWSFPVRRGLSSSSRPRQSKHRMDLLSPKKAATSNSYTTNSLPTLFLSPPPPPPTHLSLQTLSYFVAAFFSIFLPVDTTVPFIGLLDQRLFN